MGLVEANVTFDHAGKKINQGDTFDTSHYLYTMFPTRFSPISGVLGTGAGTAVGTAGTTAGTAGSLVGKYPVSNSGGTVVGWAPYYENIT